MSETWPKRSWIPLGGWNVSMTPVGGPQPRKPEPPPPPPNRIVRTPGRVRPMPPVKNALIGPGLSTWEGLVLPFLACVGFALVMGGIIYAAGKAGAAEPTCVALSSVGPGVGTVESKILWSGRACEGADGKWRWSHPASWDPVTVSDTPPVEVKP